MFTDPHSNRKLFKWHIHLWWIRFGCLKITTQLRLLGCYDSNREKKTGFPICFSLFSFSQLLRWSFLLLSKSTTSHFTNSRTFFLPSIWFVVNNINSNGGKKMIFPWENCGTESHLIYKLYHPTLISTRTWVELCGYHSIYHIVGSNRKWECQHRTIVTHIKLYKSHKMRKISTRLIRINVTNKRTSDNKRKALAKTALSNAIVRENDNRQCEREIGKNREKMHSKTAMWNDYLLSIIRTGNWSW